VGAATLEEQTLSANDIRVYSAGGETVSRVGYRADISGASFVEGEPVVDNGAAGLIVVCADDPPAVLGIAMEPALSKSNRMAGLEVADTKRIVDVPTPDKSYITRYFSTSGTGATVPTRANAVGEQAGLSLIGTHWYVDTSAANLHVTITDVLDANGHSLQEGGLNAGAGVEVVFGFN